MTVLTIPQEEYDNAAEWRGGGFPIPPEGPAIPFEICGIRDNPEEVGQTGEAVYKSGDNMGESYKYLIIHSLFDIEGQEEPGRHGEFFDLDQKQGWGIAKLKAFIESLGFVYQEGMDLNEMNGLRYTADISHRTKPDGSAQAQMDYRSIQAEDPAPPAAPAKPARPGGRSAR
ncbi:MAG: hypothetical protein ACYTBJ_00435 [Planctomycetota bacterium]|jgi:hypothetical protein